LCRSHGKEGGGGVKKRVSDVGLKCWEENVKKLVAEMFIKGLHSRFAVLCKRKDMT
jgi:hypothetical protein